MSVEMKLPQNGIMTLKNLVRIQKGDVPEFYSTASPHVSEDVAG